MKRRALGEGGRTLSDLMRLVKANSSKWIHETFSEASGFGWQAGCGAFTVSRSVTDDIRAYIANQESHHAKLTFDEEFLAFLQRHGIAYDPRDLGPS